jgi:hypothetical protein
MIIEVQLTFLLSKSSGLQSPHKAVHCTVCRGWGRCGSFHPLAAALVMAIKQRGLGLTCTVQCALQGVMLREHVRLLEHDRAWRAECSNGQKK